MFTADFFGSGNPNGVYVASYGVKYTDTSDSVNGLVVYRQERSPSGSVWRVIQTGASLQFATKSELLVEKTERISGDAYLQSEIDAINTGVINFRTIVDFGEFEFPKNVTVTIPDTGITKESVITCTMTIGEERDSDEFEFTGLQCTPVNIITGVSFDVLINDNEWGATGQYVLNTIRKK